MKTNFIAMMALTTLALGSCKKDKNIISDEPQKTLKTASVTLKNYNTEKDYNKAIVWFSVADQSAHPMEEISPKVDLQKNIAFGYNLNEINWGLYSPTAYPQIYGQEKWSAKNTTIFKQMPMHWDEFSKKVQDDPKSVDKAFINKMFDDGNSAEASVKDFPQGASYAFETANGVRGILRIKSIAQNLNTVELEIWVLQ